MATAIRGKKRAPAGANAFDAAKARTGIASDTEFVEVALASLVAEDDFGAWLLAQGGRLDADFDLDL